MTRKTEELLYQPNQHLYRAITRRKAGGTDSFLRHRVVAPPFQRFRQPVDAVQREPQCLAHVTHRRARPIGDDFRRNRRPFAPVLRVDVLKDLLPPLMLEINVYIRRLIPLLADKPLEQQVYTRRIDRGNTQTIANRRVRRRPAPLTQNPPAPGKSHEVPDRQKVVLIAKLGDEPQLVFEQLAHPAGNAAGITLRCAGPRELREMFVRAAPRGHQLVRILVVQLVQTKVAAACNLYGAFQPLGVRRVTAPKLLASAQVPLRVGEQPPARGRERALLPNARQHVLEIPPLGHVVVHVVGCNERNPGLSRQLGELLQPHTVRHVAGQLGGQVAVVAEDDTVRTQGIEGSRDQGIKVATALDGPIGCYEDSMRSSPPRKSPWPTRL